MADSEHGGEPVPATAGEDRQGGPEIGSELTRIAAMVERLRSELRAAHAGADARAVIEMAKGILVERFRCAPADAARQLDQLSERAGLTRLEFAADLVNQVAGDEISTVVGEFTPGTAPERSEAAIRLRTTESGALAAANTRRVAESMLAQAVSPLGATAIAIWGAGGDGSLTLRGFAGIGESEARRWRYVPPGVDTPAGRALRRRDALWIDDLDETGLPSIASGGGGRVVLPVGIGGRLIGILEVCWPHPVRDYPPRMRRQLEALAELCSYTLDSDPAAERGPGAEGPAEATRLADDLLDPALVLVPAYDAERALVDFRIHHLNACFLDPAGRPRELIQGASLTEAYPISVGRERLFERIERVYATGTSYRADPVTLTELSGRMPRSVSAGLSIGRHGDAVLVVWRIRDVAERSAALLRHAQRLGRVGAFEENATSGEIIWSEHLFAMYGLEPTADPIPFGQLPLYVAPSDSQAAQRFLRAVLRYRRADSAAFRIVRPDGGIRHVRIVAEPVLDPTGNLLAVRGVYQDASTQHWTEIALSATRDRLTRTEEQAAEQSQLARRLQLAIMPETQPATEIFGLRTAVRYRPTEQDHLVGGDWYDVVVLASKQILVSVGDIVGHGIAAATGMVVLRNALRGLAATGVGPGHMLNWLNQVAHQPDDTIFATVVCGLYDPETRVLRWARAGHLPPVLVRAGAASTLPAVDGMILGAVAETQYEEGEMRLEADDVLLLYTDGLIERRGRALDDCVQRLLTESARFDGCLGDRLDHLLGNSDADSDDDMCVVGLEVCGSAPSSGIAQ
ncbi:SpoIIE family protein phosphatase [Nocardia sp. CDC160]|uniref:SpoIIE family protein phosphatase n=1 Tax=Nocardia sp. CDC160 TaxID=3112166 RepID=UPI002DBB6291|nr:SpoIIE family protein phosphatase [Nocardia sp. CDC160]MEC3916815.1 SpoIIE family protein phosphatase [Nocardia sp. CDC160]